MKPINVRIVEGPPVGPGSWAVRVRGRWGVVVVTHVDARGAHITADSVIPLGTVAEGKAAYFCGPGILESGDADRSCLLRDTGK